MSSDGYGRSVIWSDETNTAVHCRVTASEAQLGQKFLVVKNVSVQDFTSDWQAHKWQIPYTAQSEDSIPPEDYNHGRSTVYTFSLLSPDGGATTMKCRVDSVHAYGTRYPTTSQRHLSIGQLQSTLAPSLQLSARTETAPEVCAAVVREHSVSASQGM
jgi:hypothetical protein